MEVYKFGGASIRNAQAVQNMARILQATQGRHFLLPDAEGQSGFFFEMT